MDACYLCGKPATGFVNLNATAFAAAPVVMRPVCSEHQPYRIDVDSHWKQIAGELAHDMGLLQAALADVLNDHAGAEGRARKALAYVTDKYREPVVG